MSDPKVTVVLIDSKISNRLVEDGFIPDNVSITADESTLMEYRRGDIAWCVDCYPDGEVIVVHSRGKILSSDYHDEVYEYTDSDYFEIAGLLTSFENEVSAIAWRSIAERAVALVVQRIGKFIGSTRRATIGVRRRRAGTAALLDCAIDSIDQFE